MDQYFIAPNGDVFFSDNGVKPMILGVASMTQQEIDAYIESVSSNSTNYEDKLDWWVSIREQRDRVLPPVVDLGLTAKAFASTETDEDKKNELESLVIECIGSDGFGGLAQELRDLPNNPSFKAGVESQGSFDSAKAYVLAWYQEKAAAASTQLRARLRGAL